jgi:hypothetical protein
MLRADIRGEIADDLGLSSNGGGDFHVPFWSDCKLHIAGKGDLTDLTKSRIAASKQRSRLYPQLEAGFLGWWNEKPRWINEPYEVLEKAPSGHFVISTLSCDIKVENLLGACLHGTEYRFGYPYFSEDPVLSEESARLGIWVLSRAFPTYPPESFRILDVLRSRSFSVASVPFQGTEEEVLLHKYRSILDERDKLREEY